ncbi:SusD/RagB family nutrient-binding outer membrane lipoprotein [Telluribacter sp. SYSU D00476]|uniref:SusD/RagB family nutrient-binding outer membrane lipoprotein n=1 Tax=Telluribacter sp. SYSU D00476 TaxID=2811430 RepID=UPI001FF0FDD8|nr:SusD/RagB family nutrient-binding outer membrane lipoprotein [Telluribacter sp. SYSU D00476]
MNVLKLATKSILVGGLLFATSCGDHLTRLNENPNGIDPSSANPNQLLPSVMTEAAKEYVSLGYGDIGGTMQHTQKDGWFSGHNHYDWSPRDWSNWYGMLRNNNFLHQRAVTLGYKFHEGVALTMKAFIYGSIADLWGDAPYSNAVRGNESNEFLTPTFDSQEAIYNGIIEDLKAASALFATGDKTGVINNYDVYYAGDPAKWQKFANTLLLRYYMRISDKKPEIAKAGIESIYNSGIYIKTSAEDATMSYIGANSSNSWPETVAFDQSESNWRRIKPGKALIDNLVMNNDPRLTVWFSPVHVQWVADPTLTVATDEFIRKDGVIQQGVKFLTDVQFRAQKALGHKFTRHFNPNLIPTTLRLDTGRYVGLPAGLLDPSEYNYNPTPGQTVENQHVSQLADVYRNSSGGILRARLASAAEASFILAEAALKGWAVGSAETHYNTAIKNSLDAWGVGSQYATFITQPGVAYKGTLAQIMEQKWIAGWTAATESWFDFRRTGFPALKAGPASPQPVLPVRFIYGDNEQNFNNNNYKNAMNALQETPYSVLRGKNSQWSKPWLMQGTNKPW